MAEMTDRELIGYCRLHCQTERALFHRDHVNRVLALAGLSPGRQILQEWMSIHEEMTELCDLAQARLDAVPERKRATVVRLRCGVRCTRSCVVDADCDDSCRHSPSTEVKLVIDADEVRFLAARLRRLFQHFGQGVPEGASDTHLIGIAGSLIGSLLRAQGEKK